MNTATRFTRTAAFGMLCTVGVGTLHAQERTLQECINEALANDRRVGMADMDERMADAQGQEARAALLPKVRGTSEYRYYTDVPYQLMPASTFGGPADEYRAIQFGTPQNISANLNLQLPLVDPAAWSAIRITHEAGSLSALQGERTREEVVMDVSNAYYNAQILQARLQFLDSNITHAGELVRNMELLHAQSMARGTDVDRSTLQRDQLITHRERLQAQYDQVLDALRLLMGLAVDAPLRATSAATESTALPLANGPSTGVRVADQLLRVKHAELSALKRSRIPSINGFGLYGTTGFGPIGLESQYEFYPVGYLGAQLQVPIFQGTVLHRKIQAKELDLEKAALQRDAVSAKDDLDRRRAARDETVARSSIANSLSQLDLADRIRRSTVLQHQEGVASLNDIVLADQAFWDAQQNYINALVDLRKAQLELARITGTLLPTQRP